MWRIEGNAKCMYFVLMREIAAGRQRDAAERPRQCARLSIFSHLHFCIYLIHHVMRHVFVKPGLSHHLYS